MATRASIPEDKQFRRQTGLTTCSYTKQLRRSLLFSRKMNIGIIGAGYIGSTLAGRLTSLGHKVSIANSRGPETLQDVVAKTGATAVTPQEAARSGEIVIVTIPLKNIPDLPQDLFEGVSDDVVVVDTSNYYPKLRDGQMPEFDGESNLTESEWVQQHLGRPVIKVFNNIAFSSLGNAGKPAGTPGRIGLPVSGDDAANKQKVMQLVDELGFDPVDGGSLHESWRQQPGTPIYGTDSTAAEIQKQLDSMGTERTPEQHQQFAANHAALEKKIMQDHS
ncbi:NADPH-dependent F420 reductase [Hymenobacter sp. GOD-10R]|uniref:NADPH-dependent F420 reductase n=1 Tax=Hymenobacter sp. GOD-10R TaxID=3093922 RepID=UPI002D778F26|nr:NAD(P)-binding domain-containing protein [Hymenobacter sp. GOD-10R]WRQ26893.1 NAD(P)-binding domain-containing protein [Hymenobacter sp. GOD-10R]